MGSLRKQRRSECNGKHKYLSLEMALEDLNSRVAHGLYEHMNAYKCRFCHQYHLGHMPAFVQRAMYERWRNQV